MLLLEKGEPAQAGGNTYFTAGAIRIAHGGLADVSDLLDADHFGWHVAHGDVDAAVKAIREAMALPGSERQAMGTTARRVLDEGLSQVLLLVGVRTARRAEYPWIVAMVAYTALSLWLLAQPLAESGSGSS